MKKILSLVIVLAAVAQVSAKGIEPHSPVGVSVVKLGEVVKLFYRGEESGTVKVTIYNEKGTAVFSETMRKTENFMRPYNFSGLPSGIYTIELTDKKGTSYRSIAHRISERKRIAVLTRLRNTDDRYVLLVPNEEKDVLTVRIYDENNKMLYEETEQIEGDFAKVYDLSRVGGPHTFVISDKNGNTNRLSKPGY